MIYLEIYHEILEKISLYPNECLFQSLFSIHEFIWIVPKNRHSLVKEYMDDVIIHKHMNI